MAHILDNKWFIEENGFFENADMKYINQKIIKYKHHIKKIFNDLPLGVKEFLLESNGTSKIQFHDIMMKRLNINENFTIESDYYSWQEQKEQKNKELTFANISNLQIMSFKDEELPLDFIQNKKFGIREGTFDFDGEVNSISLILVDRTIDTDDAKENFFRVTFNYDDFCIKNKPTHKNKPKK